jgi:presenilin-like A22 family membrane protease
VKTGLKIRYVLLLIYLATALLAIAATPKYEEAGMYAFEDPEDVSNSILYFAMILGFTAFLLVVSKLWADFLQKLMYLLVLISIYYVLIPFFGFASLLFAVALVVLLIKKPNWIVINISAFLLAAGITSIFGMSLEPLPVIVLLVILAVYDAISVYKTGHMVSLADSITKMKLPMLFIIPASKDFNISDFEGGKGKAVFMGVGDAVVPNILVVSAQIYTNSPCIGTIKASALLTLIGGILGFIALIAVMERKEGAHPGLPFLNAGAIAGYFLSLLLF